MTHTGAQAGSSTSDTLAGDHLADHQAGPEPHGWNAALLVILAITLAWGTGIGLRLVELPFWDCAYCQVEGEKLMATHDAYFWLSGAEGMNRSSERAFTRVVWAIHGLTGLDYALLGFWLPVLLAPLAVIPLCLLAWKWRMIEAGLAAGALAVGCFGYLQRTRFGFLDTDVFALFFPAALGVALIFWMMPATRRAWLPVKAADHEQPPPDVFRLWMAAAGVGVLLRAYMWIYGNAYPVAMAMILTISAVGLLLARPGLRPMLLSGILLILLIGLGGWLGLPLALGLLALSRRHPDFSASRTCAGVALLLVATVLLFTGAYAGLLWNMIRSVLSYAQLLERGTTESGVIFPSAMASIREARAPSLTHLVNQVAGHWAVFVFAVSGYVWLVWKKPLALVFLPLLGLSLAAAFMGARFTMYGGIPLGLGFGFLLPVLLERIQVRAALIRWIVVFGLTLLALFPVLNRTLQLRPSPVLSPPLAAALMQMREISAPDAWLWQWWDYGYAAQYYAQRHSFGDGGGRQHGPWLYVSALVHATNSPLQARQMMLLMADTFAAQEYAQKLALQRQDKEPRPHPLDRYSMDPGLPFAGMDPTLAQKFVDFLGEKPLRWTAGPPDHYFVVAWDNLPLANWISSFGSQNLETGQRQRGRLQRVSTRFDIQEGGIMELQNGSLPLTSLTLIREEDHVAQSWEQDADQGEVHLVILEQANRVYLMDAIMRDSMMVRLLLDDPADVAEHFELVLDDFPWARIYRVKRDSGNVP